MQIAYIQVNKLLIGSIFSGKLNDALLELTSEKPGISLGIVCGEVCRLMICAFEAIKSTVAQSAR
jgi:hypothetical protein